MNLHDELFEQWEFWDTEVDEAEWLLSQALKSSFLRSTIASYGVMGKEEQDRIQALLQCYPPSRPARYWCRNGHMLPWDGACVIENDELRCLVCFKKAFPCGDMGLKP